MREETERGEGGKSRREKKKRTGGGKMRREEIKIRMNDK